MKKIVDKLAHAIASNGNLSKDQEEVIAYGMLAFSQMVIIFLLALLCGIILGAIPECLLIFLCVGIFRKFTGGAHGSSMGQCILVSVSSIFVMAAIAKFVLARFLANDTAFFIAGAVFLFCYITVYILAPVDSPNKPIRNPKKIKRLRTCAFIYISLILVVVFSLIITYKATKNVTFLDMSYSLCLAMVWQSATLTPLFKLFKH